MGVSEGLFIVFVLLSFGVFGFWATFFICRAEDLPDKLVNPLIAILIIFWTGSATEMVMYFSSVPEDHEVGVIVALIFIFGILTSLGSFLAVKSNTGEVKT